MSISEFLLSTLSNAIGGLLQLAILSFGGWFLWQIVPRLIERHSHLGVVMVKVMTNVFTLFTLMFLPIIILDLAEETFNDFFLAWALIETFNSGVQVEGVRMAFTDYSFWGMRIPTFDGYIAANAVRLIVFRPLSLFIARYDEFIDGGFSNRLDIVFDVLMFYAIVLLALLSTILASQLLIKIVKLCSNETVLSMC